MIESGEILDADVSSRPFTPRSLRDELERRTGAEITLLVTNNRRRMVSVRRGGDGFVEVRLQEIFLRSTPEVLEELSGMIAGRDRGRAALRAFVEDNMRNRPPVGMAERRLPASPGSGRGQHHDLSEYARELNLLYLNNRSTAAVTWGRRNNRRRVRSIRFACYDLSRNLIMVNRRLDSPDIPKYFIEFCLFHEMLHEVLGIGEREDGRRDIHSRIFKLMETTFPDYDKAVRYEKMLCARLFQGNL